MKYLVTLIYWLFCISPILILLLLAIAPSPPFPHIFPAIEKFDLVHQILQSEVGWARSFFTSLLIASAVAVVVTVVAFPLSKALAYHPLKELWKSLAYFPFAISPVVYAYLIQFPMLFMGLAGHMLGVVLALSLLCLPFAVLLFLPHWSAQLAEMQQLAQTLGASRNQVLKNVVLPLSWPILQLVGIQVFLIAWLDYGVTSVIGQGQTQTLSLKTYRYITEGAPQWAAFSSLLMLLPCLFLLYCSTRITKIS